MHFAERYKRKIRELEADRERLENRVIEEHAENILLREELCRLRSEMKEQQDRQRNMETENLRLRSELMNEQFKNEKQESDLAKKQELEQAFMNLQSAYRELEKKLNIRKGNEEPFGLSTPSSRKLFKPTSSEENQKKKGGAQEGHTGHGRKKFNPEESEIETNKTQPSNCVQCGADSWKFQGYQTSYRYVFQPMKLKKVIEQNAIWRCLECGNYAISKPDEREQNMMFDKASIANMLCECYLYNTPVGQLTNRLGINRGTFFGMAHRTAKQVKPYFKKLLEELAMEPLLHADETGTRINGTNGFIWMIGNNRFRIFLHRTTRSSKEIQEVLGNARTDMVLVTDRYSGYNKLKVKRQFCYVHLLRDIKKEKETFPDDAEVQLFCSQLSELLKMAIGMYGAKGSLRNYRKKAEQIKSQIMEICNCSAQHPAVQNLQNIFREKENCLFQWTRSPDIPCDNNFAERALRPLVVARKISYGSQSLQGMETREILSSILHTAKVRNLDPASFLESLMGSQN